MKNYYFILPFLACLTTSVLLTAQTLTNSGATNCLGVAKLSVSGVTAGGQVQFYNGSNLVSTATANYLTTGTTVAGTGSVGSLATQLNFATGVFVDASGNVYVADNGNYRVQKFPPNSASGTSGFTVAGQSSPAFGTDAAHLSNPYGVFVDASGNVYVSDNGNHRVQKWAPGATFGVTVAGQSVPTSGSDASHLKQPRGIYVDASGNIYVSDYGNHRVQKWTPGASSGTTVAGQSNATSGSGTTQLNNPNGVWVDASGNVYVGDAGNNRVQKWALGASAGSTVAGGNGTGIGLNKLNTPSGIWIDAAGNLYVADNGYNRIQKFPAGSTSATSGVTVAGTSSTTGANDAMHLNSPTGVAVDASGNVFIADYFNSRIQEWAFTGTTYTPVSAGSYTAVVTVSGTPTTTNAITVGAAVAPSVLISIISGNQTTCPNTNVTFTATPTNGGAAPAFQWKKNGASVGANSVNYSDATLANGDVIACVLTSNAACVSTTTATSTSLTMTVNTTVVPALSIAVTGGSQNICAGATGSFSATPFNGGTAPSYQWKKNGTNVGTNSAAYSDATLINNDAITCVMTSNALCPAPATATSNNLTMTVTPTVTPEVTIAITAGSQTMCSGTSATFTATPANGGAGPAYQWKKNNVNVVGANSSSYTDAALANNDVLTCVLTSAAACPSPTAATSNSVTMNIIAVVVPSVTIAITSGSQSIYPGASVTFTASATNGGTAPVYQWKKNGANAGANSATYTDAALANSDVISCALTSNAVCVSPASTVSNSITMTVTTVANPSYCLKVNKLSETSANLTVEILLSSSDNAAWNADATLNISGSGSISGSYVVGNTGTIGASFGAAKMRGNTGNDAGQNPIFTYQFMFNKSNSAAPASFTIDDASGNYGVKDGNLRLNRDLTGCPVNCLISPTAAISSSADAAKDSICAGSNVTFTVSTVHHSGTAPSYQWLVNNMAVGTNSATYTYAPANGDSVSVLMTSDTASFSPGCLIQSVYNLGIAGVQAKAAAIYIKVDATPPVLSVAPANATADCAATLTAPTLTATDNFDPHPSVSIVETRTDGSCANNYTLTRTWTATDVCGNHSTALQVVTVQDITAPTLSAAPAAVTVACASIPAASVSLVTATDNCTATPAIVITVADATTPGSCAGNYTLTRVWTAADVCNNSSTVSQIITVQDNTAPTLAGVPASVTVECSAVPAASIGSVNATDGCDPHPSLSVADVVAAGSCAGNYTLTRTWTATDACGNSAAATQIITVQDKTAPVLAGVPVSATVECSAGPAASGSLVTATDNCDPNPAITVADVKTAGSCIYNYTITRSWTATDGCGNSATASQIITVQDKTPPTLAGVPANILAGCSEIPVAATVTATDNCDAHPNLNLVEINTAGSGATYTLTRTWTASDVCGNSATASQVVTVQDISILTQPAGLSACAGATSALSVSATGGANIIYQWQSRTGTAAFSSIAGANAATYVPGSQTTGNVDYQVIVSAAGTSCTAATSNTATVVTVDCIPKIRLKVFLEGAYNVSTGLMSDGLRAANKIPSAQPYNTLTFGTSPFPGNSPSPAYAGTETVPGSVLAVSAGDSAIVDWVLIEIRDAMVGNAIIITRRAALLRQDGKIVDMDGYSPVAFKDLASSGGSFNYLLNGAYHISVRHRLALGTRTQNSVPVGMANTASPSLTDLDFTTTTNALAGSRKTLSNGKYALYMGDTDRDGLIGAQDIANLRNRNPTPPVFFLYESGYDLDFDASIFSSDVSFARGNNPVSQIDLKQ